MWNTAEGGVMKPIVFSSRTVIVTKVPITTRRILQATPNGMPGALRFFIADTHSGAALCNLFHSIVHDLHTQQGSSKLRELQTSESRYTATIPVSYLRPL